MDDVIDLDDAVEQRRQDLRARFTKNTEECSLELLLRLYMVNPKAMYVDDFEIFKLFIQWLGTPRAQECPRVPDPLVSYEVQRIARILSISQDEVWHTLILITNTRTLN